LFAIPGFGFLWFSIFFVVPNYNADLSPTVTGLRIARILLLVILAIVFAIARRERLPRPLLWVAAFAQVFSWICFFAWADTNLPLAWLGAILGGCATALFILFFAQTFSRYSHKSSAIAIFVGFGLSHLMSIFSLYAPEAARPVVQAIALAMALLLLVTSQLVDRTMTKPESGSKPGSELSLDLGREPKPESSLEPAHAESPPPPRSPRHHHRPPLRARPSLRDRLLSTHPLAVRSPSTR
jgi:hypothetical protein